MKAKLVLKCDDCSYELFVVEIFTDLGILFAKFICPECGAIEIINLDELNIPLNCPSCNP